MRSRSGGLPSNEASDWGARAASAMMRLGLWRAEGGGSNDAKDSRAEGSKRRKRFLVVLPFIVFGALLLAISGSAGNSTLANFEIDGDLYSGTFNVGPTAIGLDWIRGAPELATPVHSYVRRITPVEWLPNTCLT